MLRAGNHAKHFRRALVQGCGSGKPEYPRVGPVALKRDKRSRKPSVGCGHHPAKFGPARGMRHPNFSPSLRCSPRAALRTRSCPNLRRSRVRSDWIALQCELAEAAAHRHPEKPEFQWNSTLNDHSCSTQVFLNIFLNVRCSKVGQAPQVVAGFMSPGSSRDPALAPVCLRNTYVLC